MNETLRKLEQNGLVKRTLYADVLPIKAEHRLIELDKILLFIVQAAKLWTEENLHQIEENRML